MFIAAAFAELVANVQLSSIYSYFEIQTIKDVHKQIKLIAYTRKLVRLKSNLYCGVLTS